ncbi:MAG TPA: acetoacetate decarboxylase family protein [Miltoncostaeaceae bacterium]|nr:acetoacetate decarboxylase family protein [Miltoncostaeaceae bacterium]
MPTVNAPDMPWIDGGEAPPLPLDRAPQDILAQGIADPLYDIDALPVTITGSRWMAFIYRSDERTLRRMLPDCLVLEDDVVEVWYARHPHTTMGPYNEMGVTVAVSMRAADGRTLRAGYYPYMFLDQDLPFALGHEVYGFGKKLGFIVAHEHGGGDDDGYGPPPGDWFTCVLERRGYLIHTATGRYDDGEVGPRPVFYGNPEYGRVNLRMLTDPSLRTTRWELAYLAPRVDAAFAVRLGDPAREGTPRLRMRPETMRTASPGAIRSWALQATPFDNPGHFLPVVDLHGMVSFTFDLAIPPAETVWERTVERTDEDLADLMWATPYRYTMRHRFPKPPGA